MRLFLAFLLFTPFAINAQETDAEKSGDLDTLSVTLVKDSTHSPKKAALLSLVPGGGQIYNHLAMPKGKKKAFWKIPIIYAGLGATGYRSEEHTSELQSRPHLVCRLLLEKKKQN